MTGSEGIAATPAKERRLVVTVREYSSSGWHFKLIEARTQNAIVKCAQEDQHKYILVSTSSSTAAAA